MATIRILSTSEGAPGDVAFTLAAEEVTLGRDADNSIVVADRAVSRRHAKIVRTTRGYLLVDLGSGNSVWMGSTRVQNYFLKNGDVFRIGRTLLKFEEEAFDPPDGDLHRGAALRGSTEGIPVWGASGGAAAASPALSQFVVSLIALLFLLTLGAAVAVVVLGRRGTGSAPKPETATATPTPAPGSPTPVPTLAPLAPLVPAPASPGPVSGHLRTLHSAGPRPA